MYIQHSDENDSCLTKDKAFTSLSFSHDNALFLGSVGVLQYVQQHRKTGEETFCQLKLKIVSRKGHGTRELTENSIASQIQNSIYFHSLILCVYFLSHPKYFVTLLRPF